MTPAALQALLRGEHENFVAAITPGGIEAQEKRGQIEQSFMETLPKKCDRALFEKAGFKFGNEADDLFMECTFPKGWKKRLTEHAMWSHIVDDKERKRGGIFYKAAFYDRSAHAHLEPRFTITQNWGEPTRTVSIQDECGEVKQSVSGLLAPDWKDRVEARKRDDAIEKATAKLTAWLDEHYPDWKSPVAYWD